MKKNQLFLLHFAGGNCYSYDFLRPLLKDLEVIALELPGRGKRVREGLLRNFDQAALDLYHQLTGRLTASTYLIYGHSLGAYLALRVCGMLEKAGERPAYLIVSGNPGPGIARDYNYRQKYLMDRDALRDELKRLGGMPGELMNNAESFNYFEPILRADFEIAETSQMGHEPPVTTPLHAIMGSEEEKTGLITNWGRFTRSRFGYELIEGDHFFIHAHPDQLARIIHRCCHSLAPGC
jgi:surfactin synthase thioesterase subunit